MVYYNKIDIRIDIIGNGYAKLLDSSTNYMDDKIYNILLSKQKDAEEAELGVWDKSIQQRIIKWRIDDILKFVKIHEYLFLLTLETTNCMG